MMDIFDITQILWSNRIISAVIHGDIELLEYHSIILLKPEKLSGRLRLYIVVIHVQIYGLRKPWFNVLAHAYIKCTLNA